MTQQGFVFLSILLLTAAPFAVCQDASAPDPTKETQGGIPVTDQLTVAKCGGCHAADTHGNLTRISWIRTTPEGWEEAIKRMVQLNGVQLGPEDARHIVKYLADDHGLAPEEVAPVRWYLEKTDPQSEPIPTPAIRHACASCHSFARPQTWRRSAAEWHLLRNMHIGYFPLSQFVAFSEHSRRPEDPNAPPSKQPVEEALTYLSQNYDLYSAAWSKWRAQMTDPDLTGRWLVNATLPGKGKYFGDMTVTRVSPGSFTTQAHLVSVLDGTKLDLPGKSFVYTGYEWRGTANSAPYGTLREVMALSADQSTLQGRWFWGAYQEFGFTVSLRRGTRDLSVLGTDAVAIHAGSQGVKMRVFGDNLPSDLKPGDINLGSGVIVSSVASANPSFVTLIANVSPNVVSGKRSISVRGHLATDAFSVYDKIEYIKVSAETALAHTGGTVGKKGFVQYEAHAFSNGLDGLPNTPDDVDLGPIAAKWSIEEFISHNNDNDKEFVGYINSEGLFTPAGDGPNPQRRLQADNVGDIWIIAKYSGKDAGPTPLEAKSYLVVTVPDFLRFDQPEIASR